MGTHHRCTWNCGATDCGAPMRTITTWEPHGVQPGDIISVHAPRRQTLLKLLTRPRVTVVGEVTGRTFSLHERRMTWPEWWRAMQSAILG